MSDKVKEGMFDSGPHEEVTCIFDGRKIEYALVCERERGDRSLGIFSRTYDVEEAAEIVNFLIDHFSAEYGVTAEKMFYLICDQRMGEDDKREKPP